METTSGNIRAYGCNAPRAVFPAGVRKGPDENGGKEGPPSAAAGVTMPPPALAAAAPMAASLAYPPADRRSSSNSSLASLRSSAMVDSLSSRLSSSATLARSESFSVPLTSVVIATSSSARVAASALDTSPSVSLSVFKPSADCSSVRVCRRTRSSILIRLRRSTPARAASLHALCADFLVTAPTSSVRSSTSACDAVSAARSSSSRPLASRSSDLAFEILSRNLAECASNSQACSLKSDTRCVTLRSDRFSTRDTA